LNDTHPSLAIVELLRFLVDVEEFEVNQAWNIVVSTFSYTNHTVLPEALEKWNVEMFSNLLPRHMELIYLINYFWIEKLKVLYPNDM
jgi:starch phosphorylase